MGEVLTGAQIDTYRAQLYAPHRKVVGANLGSGATSPIAYPRSEISVIMHERWKR